MFDLSGSCQACGRHGLLILHREDGQPYLALHFNRADPIGGDACKGGGEAPKGESPMPCVHCNRVHEDICTKNPAYFDGEDDRKVPPGSQSRDEE